MKNHPMKNELETIARRSVPEDINLWPSISARLERKSRMLTPRTRPFVTILVTLLILLVLSGVAYALGKAFGYIPGVGLVENSSGIRILAEPVLVTREGVSLTVTQVLVYADHVQLVYEVSGIAPENDSTTFSFEELNKADQAAFCGGTTTPPFTDNDARLRLPDGTFINRAFGTDKYPENVFAMKPAFEAAIPADVTELKMLLKCIPWARLGAVPENWEIPLKLKHVPAGTVIGAPVIEVDAMAVKPTMQLQLFPETPNIPATATSNVPAPVVTMTLEKIVPLETRTVFYFSMDMENRDPSLISIMPVNVYVTDSLGQKLPLVGGFAWQPFEHRVGSAFEFTSQTKPAPGPLTLTVENAVAYYAPLHTESPQATPDEMSFSFDAGENPQPNQTWILDDEFTIAGYKLKVTSARMTNYEDVKSRIPDFNDYSQGYEYGYDFAVETDPSVKLQVEMDIMSESPQCYLTNTTSLVPQNSSFHYVQLCRDTYPKGNVRMTIRELSVLMENAWQVVWNP